MRETYFISKIGLLFLCFIAFNQNIEAQILNSKKTVRAAADHIVGLQKGTLIVRLPSKHKNITAIQEILDRDKISKKGRKNLKKKLKRTIKNRNKANKEIVSAFKNNYNFSNYLFMYDTAMVQLLRGAEKGFFLNDNLEIDPTITLNKRAPRYTLRQGQTKSSETHNLEGFIIGDNENIELKPPFPYFQKISFPLTSFVDAFLGKSEYTLPRYQKMVTKLNQRLEKFYAKITDTEVE